MRREWSVAIAIALLAIVLAFAAPSYFSGENLRDLFLVNMPVLVVAIGATLIILTGEIDISVGSAFAVCGVVAGVAAKAGMPAAAAGLVACAVGAGLGALNGALVAYGRMPSIVVTLATMVALRDALRWTTQGAWVENLPPRFQWLGFTQASFPIAGIDQDGQPFTPPDALASDDRAVCTVSVADGPQGQALATIVSEGLGATSVHGADLAIVVTVEASRLVHLAADLSKAVVSRIPKALAVALKLRVREREILGMQVVVKA